VINLSRLPVDLTGMDEDEDAQSLAKLPMLADRMVYHTKRLRVIRYVNGIDGVKRYKAKYPDAKTIQVRATTFAFQPKPEGYGDHLYRLVDSWFQSETALAETNRADVLRLNEAMQPRQFNPDNHFSKPLSPTLVGKLADVFAKHGVHLAGDKPMSMSKVRAAVKASRGKRSAGRPFGNIGHIVADQLTVGSQSFQIEEHNGHDCIRIMANGSRVRLRLDGLAGFIGLVGSGGDFSLSSSIENRTGELAPNAEADPEPDSLADILSENWPQPPHDRPPFLTGELAPDASGSPSLSERIAALVAARQPHTMTCVDDRDDDPLNPLAST
jgi:hypothetical protein